MTTSHPYAQALETVLAAFPSRLQRSDFRARRAVRAALDALREGASPEQALAASRSSLEPTPHTPAAPWPFSPPKGQKAPRRTP